MLRKFYQTVFIFYFFWLELFFVCCASEEKNDFKFIRSLKNHVVTVPSNSAWPTPTMMMDMGSFAPWGDREEKIPVNYKMIQ